MSCGSLGRGMDMRKQVAVEPADYPRGYVVLSLSPRHTLRNAMHRLLTGLSESGWRGLYNPRCDPSRHRPCADALLRM